MDKPIPKIGFIGMSFAFKCRDLFRPREKIVEEVDIKPDSTVLDFGCGSGSYIIPAVNSVGKNGKVYALDIHPLAIKKVKSIASKLALSNVATICSDCATALPSKEIDTVLLYDIFHMLGDKEKVLLELHRVLKDDGILSFSDHHMKEKDILSAMKESTLFELHKKNKWTYTFVKKPQA